MANIATLQIKLLPPQAPVAIQIHKQVMKL